MSKYTFIHSDELDQGGYPDSCPFNSKRSGMTRKSLESIGLLDNSDIRIILPIKAVREELEAFHSSRYLDAILAVEKGDLSMDSLSMGLGTPDCPIFSGMYDYVALACGGSITGARIILNQEADVVFNPSGGFHHAGPELASGFCYMNDVVLAAQMMTGAGKRVLFMDVDVHHGDGVQNAFYDRCDVMTISLHENGRFLFPGTGFANETGSGDGAGYCLNIPLPPGTYDEAYYRAFTQIALPAAKEYDPDVIILELGMDALSGDPLAHLELTNNLYVDVIDNIISMGKPILATGGGGYNIENTVRGWALAWKILSRQDDEYDAAMMMDGVMMQNTEWAGGLRDRLPVISNKTRNAIEPEIDRIIENYQCPPNV
ncbi:acetoin utilization protein AcuC [PVC group bacterium]|nr:acetoin utilization protein AcuC [PVC group bacterium]